MADLDKYPSPLEDESFKKYWEAYLPSIEDRDNLKKSHLKQLEILCHLCVELDEIRESLSLGGRTYESIGRNGLQIKLRPEVSMIRGILADIRSYSKMLGLVLEKDRKTTKEEEENGFDD